MEKHKICCVTGHRPGGFPWVYNDKTCPEHREYLQTMHTLLEKLITEQGFDFFICGGAIGVDMDFAETVLCLKEKYPHKLPVAGAEGFQQSDFSGFLIYRGNQVVADAESGHEYDKDQ